MITALHLQAVPTGGSYAIVQIESVAAVILTYDCDIDRGLESIIRSREPTPAELVTVTAVRLVDDFAKQRLDQIRRGDMPRFATIEASGEKPECYIDFGSVQQISLRVLVPLSIAGRRYGMTSSGQLRLLERLAHSMGDVYRRGTDNHQGSDAPSLLHQAYEALTP